VFVSVARESKCNTISNKFHLQTCRACNVGLITVVHCRLNLAVNFSFTVDLVYDNCTFSSSVQKEYLDYFIL
jgi:hypothetical protein